MNTENTESLLKKYPKIFIQHKLPMTQTCMCWLFECGDGWHKIIDVLCSHLQWDIDHNGYPQIEATQVKEKFGTLRFYYGYAESEIEYEDRKYGHQDGMISLAESLSGYICEECGSTDGVKQTKGWIISLCKPCMDRRNKK